MEKYIKKWLGVEKIENRLNKIESFVGKEEEPKDKGGLYSVLDSLIFNSWGGGKKTLADKYDQLRKDFEELDKKYDALERYLKIEYVKTTEETQTYDWADKKNTEGYRKTKSYDEVKSAKQRSSDEA